MDSFFYNFELPNTKLFKNISTQSIIFILQLKENYQYFLSVYFTLFLDPATFVHMSVSCSSLLFCKHWLFSPGKKVILDDVIKSSRPWNLHNLKSFLSNLHPSPRTLCLSHIYFPYIQFLVCVFMFTMKFVVNVVQLL